ncbi:hypothetical protein BJV82DRAFT_663849 [Fennellomyces sp. T-0311]|nr:hypothetical protein BJV82DRAFT_663849 [Fennellomyces sp. T-0311]
MDPRLIRNSSRDEGSSVGNTEHDTDPLDIPVVEGSLRSLFALSPDGYTQLELKTIDRICRELLQEHAGAKPTLDIQIRMRFVVDIVHKCYERSGSHIQSNGPFTVENECAALIQHGMKRVDENFKKIWKVVGRSIVEEIQHAARLRRASERKSVSPAFVPQNMLEFPPILMWLSKDDDHLDAENFLRGAYSGTNDDLLSLSWPIYGFDQDREHLMDKFCFRGTLMPPHVRRTLGIFTQLQVAKGERFRALPISPKMISSRVRIDTLGDLIDEVVDLKLTHLTQVRVCPTSRSNTYRLYFLIHDLETVATKIVMSILEQEGRRANELAEFSTYQNRMSQSDTRSDSTVTSQTKGIFNWSPGAANASRRRVRETPPSPRLTPTENEYVSAQLRELSGTTKKEYIDTLPAAREQNHEQLVDLFEVDDPEYWMPESGINQNSLVDTLIAIMRRENTAVIRWPYVYRQVGDTYDRLLPEEITRYTGIRSVGEMLKVAECRNEGSLISLIIQQNDEDGSGAEYVLMFLTPVESAIYDALP